MPRMAAWLQASRPLAQINIAMPLLLGQALAFAAHGSFSWSSLALLHGFGLLDQLFIVFANDSADADTDRLNESYAPYSGGSRVVPEGKLTPQSLRVAALVAGAALLALSAWIALGHERPLVLLAAASAICLMWAYSFPPLRLSYRGHGELLQGLGLGVVLPLLAYYVQAGSLAAFPYVVLFPAFVLGYVGNVATSLPDYPSDLASAKRSYPVRVGQYRARRHSLELLALAACLSPLVIPAAPLAAVGLAVIVPLGVLAANLPLLGSADAANRTECHRFVMVDALALNLILGAWTVGAFLSR